MNPILESFAQQFGTGAAWVLTSTVIFLRYALPASIVFYIFYKWKREAWFSLKIQQKFPKNTQIREEIIYSLLTSLIFGGMAMGVFVLRKMGYGHLYFNIAEQGWGYYFFSIGFMVVAHDTYFYWMHRLMHHPRLFKLFHLVHHRSVNPTPYTSFSFHPLESVLEFGIVPLLAFLMPVHWSALAIFTLWSIVFNVLGHTGYEFSPSGFTRHPIFKWFNTPTHHNMHHHRSNFNYSLYFNFWDRVMGTNHPEYDQYFEKIKERQLPASTPQKPILKNSLTVICLIFSSLAFGQLTFSDIKNGNYGSPKTRASQMDSMMQTGLQLSPEQAVRVGEINLRYAERSENEVVQQKMSDWSKYRKVSALQKLKDSELRPVLTAEQFSKYAARRDELFWQAIREMLF